MNFEHPAFLWALLFLAIPIIVHLFNFRKYQKIIFTNTKLLKSLLEDTKKSSELKKKWVLFSRLMAVFFLILAFAQPFLNFWKNSSPSKHSVCSIYIDNSYSMEESFEGKTNLEQAKIQAKSLLDISKEKAKYQILTNDAKGLQLQILSYNEALLEIDKISLSSLTSNFKSIFDKQQQIVEQYHADKSYFYWISDFQSYQCVPIENPKKYPIHAIPIQTNTASNIWIDSAYLNAERLKMNQDISLIVKLKKSKESSESSALIAFEMNESFKAEHRVHWNDKNECLDTFRFKVLKENWNKLKLRLSGNQSTFDNNYYLAFDVSAVPKVMIFNQNADVHYLKKAFEVDKNFEPTISSNFSIAEKDIEPYHLLVFNQWTAANPAMKEQLVKACQKSKNCLILLPQNISLESYNELFKNLEINTLKPINVQNVVLNQLNTQSDLLKNILLNSSSSLDFPTFNSYFPLEGYSKRVKEVLMSFNVGHPFLIKYSKIGEGSIYIMTSSIDIANSSFVNSSLFAPILFRMGNSAQFGEVYSYSMDEKSILKIPIVSNHSDQIFSFHAKNYSSIPPQRIVGKQLNISMSQDLPSDGFYELKDNYKENNLTLALNFSRKESEPIFLNPDELQNLYSSQNVTLSTIQHAMSSHQDAVVSPSYWKILLVLALFFLLLEMVLIVYFDKIKSNKSIV